MCCLISMAYTYNTLQLSMMLENVYTCLQFIIPFFFPLSVSILMPFRHCHSNQFLCNPCALGVGKLKKWDDGREWGREKKGKTHGTNAIVLMLTLVYIKMLFFCLDSVLPYLCRAKWFRALTRTPRNEIRRKKRANNLLISKIRQFKFVLINFAAGRFTNRWFLSFQAVFSNFS